MIFHNEEYSVVTSVEEKTPLDQYDIVHNMENISKDDFYMARIFQIDRADGCSKKIALIDPICANYEPDAWFEQNEIHCRDFLGWHYVLDFNGKLLREFKEFDESETLS